VSLRSGRASHGRARDETRARKFDPDGDLVYGTGGARRAL